jgi:hypothetical protein
VKATGFMGKYRISRYFRQRLVPATRASECSAVCYALIALAIVAGLPALDGALR